MRVTGENVNASGSLRDGESVCHIEIIGKTKQMEDCILSANKAAESDITVLLEGETGVGKDLFARYIHENSKRAEAPFHPVHCAAIPDTLFEAELFGYERGAFTNAYASHRGYFEQADGGTIFLDEVSEIRLNLQVKLLRVLEEKCVMHLAGEKWVRVDVRIIAASQHDLLSVVRQGKFRNDLYYRLAVWVIRIPPLRDRKSDISLLVQHFLTKNGSDRIVLSSEALAKLSRYDWPGNVRELDSTIARAIILAGPSGAIATDDIVLDVENPQSSEIERQELEEALRNSGGCIATAARSMRVHRNTLYSKARRLGVSLDHFRLHGTSHAGGRK